MEKKNILNFGFGLLVTSNICIKPVMHCYTLLTSRENNRSDKKRSSMFGYAFHIISVAHCSENKFILYQQAS